MKICFLGRSFAALHLKMAAQFNGFEVCDDKDRADLIFVSEDVDTNPGGHRVLDKINELVAIADDAGSYSTPLVITSQVPPGYTRKMGRKNVIYQAESLRISDAVHRALHPEQIVCGKDETYAPSLLYVQYLASFDCPVHWMTWEGAEFSKIAINMMLASQVDTTNRLAAAAEKCGAKWDDVKKALELDSRIGKYLTPGRWQDSIHLLRDYVTLKEIEDAR